MDRQTDTQAPLLAPSQGQELKGLDGAGRGGMGLTPAETFTAKQGDAASCQQQRFLQKHVSQAPGVSWGKDSQVGTQGKAGISGKQWKCKPLKQGDDP